MSGDLEGTEHRLMVKELILILIIDFCKALHNLELLPRTSIDDHLNSPLLSLGAWGFALMVFRSVSLLIQSNLSRYWDLNTLLIHAFADGVGNPCTTSVDPESNAFTSSIF